MNQSDGHYGGGAAAAGRWGLLAADRGSLGDPGRAGTASSASTAVGELLVVDPGVTDAHLLIAGRRPGIEVMRLEPGGRGLEQIAGHLASLRGLVALHILSNGGPGALVLAGERIELPALAMRPGVMADISEALDAEATVVLYGCSVAAGAAGLRFLDYLEAALGVAVAASAGPVGAAALGGRWTLRNRDGAVVATAFEPMARAAYRGLFTGTDYGAGPARSLAGVPES